MVMTNHQHGREYRVHWLVSTCSTCLLIVWALAWFASTPPHADSVALSAVTTIPQVDSAVNELHATLTTEVRKDLEIARNVNLTSDGMIFP